ncbi:biotin-dependent carboxyltransferase family protein [Halalkalibacillus halophilus]|uniref:5-oxoprolinase subunit C family protein n=1 Tax=Halalkalibacillus halophilus TaxID=392827 RepID=UPI00041E5501|nr:biotin-dependent carboxyltransferase family protein [Halalkalibacillus halophilus]
MSDGAIKVIEPGLMLTIQDLGRVGYQDIGVPVSGALDRYALILGNRMVGNEDHAAGLEVTYSGAELECLDSLEIVITGADLSVQLDGEDVERYALLHVEQGQVLTFNQPKAGVRAYICIAGGVKSPVYLESQSTYERGGFGKRLESGEVIHVASQSNGIAQYKASIEDIPTYTKEVTLRVIESPYADKFTAPSIDYFYQAEYVMKKGDRMGCVLEAGEQLKHLDGADIVSNVTTFGTIQVPSSGQPMILLADRQTTGGYATLGTVITVDHYKLAQLPPGGLVRFKKVTLKEAESILSDWRK